MEPLPLQLKFPTRPKYVQREGHRKIQLVSNHYNLSLNKNQPKIFMYSIMVKLNSDKSDIDPDNRPLMYGLMSALKTQIEKAVGKGFWFSGKVLWALKDQAKIQSYVASYQKQEYLVVVEKVKDISLNPQDITEANVGPQVKQFVNVIIKKYFKSQGYTEWGKNSKFYNPQNITDLNQQCNIPLSIWTGFKTSCEVYQHNKLKVLIDFSSRILRDGSALDFLYQLGNDQAKVVSQGRDLIGRSVVSKYGNYRMWKVDDIDFTKSPSHQFKDQNNQSITLAEYYFKRYGIKIKNKNQPLLVNKDRKTQQISYLLPELMTMTGLDDRQRANFKLMQSVADYTRLEPADRQAKNDGFSGELGGFLNKEYNMALDPNSRVEGIELKSPNLLLDKKMITPDRGGFQLRDKVWKKHKFDNWVMVYPGDLYEDAGQFFTNLQKASSTFGIHVSEPTWVECDFRGRDRNQVGQMLKNQVKQSINKKTQIVVCMFSPPNKYLYDYLKDLCCKELGIPSQAVVNKSLQKNTLSVCSKIIVQMNAKVGFEPWLIDLPEGTPKNVMVVGADVFHRFDKDMNSCIGFCASIDPQLGQFYSQIQKQKQGEEIMLNIGKLIREAIIRYSRRSGALPEIIIFYRDGVGEGQIETIVKHEIKAIKQEIDNFIQERQIPKYKPKFAEIIVTKKVNDRFFREVQASGGGGRGGFRGRGGRGGGSSGNQRGGAGSSKPSLANPAPGTVVYQECVSDSMGYDFFLVAQHVNKGTCTPTHYRVIYDDTGLTQDFIWQFTYNQCYNYFNWTGSVKVPAPIQYADKLAYLIGHHVKGQQPNENLSEKLFYL